MRKLILSLAVVGSLFGWGGHAMMHGYYGDGMMYGPYGRGNCNITPTQKYNITQKDIDALKYMYQEEKLARDVYITLGKKWGFIIFQNISDSEQRHMDAVKALLDKYNIPVPLTNDEVGYFKGEFKNLYNELVSKGLKSPEDALEVGKEIEVLDIKDLEEKMKNTTPDIEQVFSFLEMGSEHHLRAFTAWLRRY